MLGCSGLQAFDFSLLILVQKLGYNREIPSICSASLSKGFKDYMRMHMYIAWYMYFDFVCDQTKIDSLNIGCQKFIALQITKRTVHV